MPMRDAISELQYFAQLNLSLWFEHLENSQINTECLQGSEQCYASMLTDSDAVPSQLTGLS